MHLLQIYQWVCQWKNFENRLTFGEVMGKSLVFCFFLRHSVLLLLHQFNSLFYRTIWVSQYQKCKNQSGFEWGKRQWGLGLTVASAGPYANNLHLAPDRQPHQHLITQFLQAGCFSWRPTSSVKALKAHQHKKHLQDELYYPIINAHAVQESRATGMK